MKRKSLNLALAGLAVLLTGASPGGAQNAVRYYYAPGANAGPTYYGGGSYSFRSPGNAVTYYGPTYSSFYPLGNAPSNSSAYYVPSTSNSRYYNPGPYYYTPSYSFTPGYYSYYYTPGYFRY